MSQRLNLRGKNIAITGGAGGLGMAMAKEFARRGAHVDLLDKDATGLASGAKTLEDKGFSIQTFVLDVTRESDFKKYFKQRRKARARIDVWVNNAGIAQPGNFDKRSVTEISRLLQINLYGVIHGTYYAMEFMKSDGGGRIVNIASVAGHVPSPFLASYAASKHGVVGFTRSLALECHLRFLPFSFCLVSPGFADTAIMKTNPKMRSPSWLVSQPAVVAKQIVNAVIRGDTEVYPARTGAFSVMSYKYLPNIFTSISRLLFANNARESIGWDSIQR